MRLSIHLLYSKMIKQVKDYKYKKVYSAILKYCLYSKIRKRENEGLQTKVLKIAEV